MKWLIIGIVLMLCLPAFARKNVIWLEHKFHKKMMKKHDPNIVSAQLGWEHNRDVLIVGVRDCNDKKTMRRIPDNFYQLPVTVHCGEK
jgi:hypothetical protein